jgi:hypothetical protein
MEGKERGIKCVTRKIGFGSPVSHARISNLPTWFFFHDSLGNFLFSKLQARGDIRDASDAEAGRIKSTT